MSVLMTVTFFSNFLLHHQTPFCEEMVARLGDGFTFVATEKTPEERLKLGYSDLNHTEGYVLNAHESDEAKEKALHLAVESDVVILGSAPSVFIKERMQKNLLTFRYCERLLKNGKKVLFNPAAIRSFYQTHTRFRNKNMYMLCASAYTAPDCRSIFAYPNKTFRWGYFPEVKQYEDVQKLIAAKKKNSILWAGRFLDWKHPEDALFVAKELKKLGYSFSMELIGTGEMESSLKKQIEIENLGDYVSLPGAMSPEEVRVHMESADIYLFTSDRQEGWGAVLNESMNSLCAVVANRAIGSVPFLLENGKNGCVYSTREELLTSVKFLLEHPSKKEELQVAAYKTLTDTWNAENAVRNLLRLIQTIKEGGTIPYDNVPCGRC